MKPCPVCGGKLKMHPSEMREFTWTDPYITCESSDCGFMYNEKKKPTMIAGINGFDADMMSKDSAERSLCLKFDIKTRQVSLKTTTVYE